MATNNCPTDGQLDAYIAGSLSRAEIEQLEGHLGSCEHCRNKLKTSGDDDRLLSKLRAAARGGETVTEVAGHRDETVVVGRQRARVPEIPGYEILHEIGRGGMGVVYRATQMPLGREVALKILPSNLATIRPDAVDRFTREASAASTHAASAIQIFPSSARHFLLTQV